MPTSDAVSHYVYATLSLEVYSKAGDTVDLPSGRVPAGWRVLTEFNPADFGDSDGFFAKSYINDAKTQIIIAVRGTSDIFSDGYNDLLLALGQTPTQFDDLKAFVDSVRAYQSDHPTVADAEIVGFTGHSLGAYLAQMAASHYNIPAVVFDSPGYSGAASNLISTYNAAPNLVNVASAEHREKVIRVYPPYKPEAWPFFLQQHSMNGIFKQFSQATGKVKISSDMTGYWQGKNWPSNEFTLDSTYYYNYDQNPFYWELSWVNQATSKRISNIYTDRGGIGNPTTPGVTLIGDDSGNVFFGGTNYADVLRGGSGNDIYYPFGGNNVIYDDGGTNEYHFSTHNMKGVTAIHAWDLNDHGSIYIGNHQCAIRKAYLVTHSADPLYKPLYFYSPVLNPACNLNRYSDNLIDHKLDMFFMEETRQAYTSWLFISYNSYHFDVEPKNQIYITSDSDRFHYLGINLIGDRIIEQNWLLEHENVYDNHLFITVNDNEFTVYKIPQGSFDCSFTVSYQTYNKEMRLLQEGTRQFVAPSCWENQSVGYVYRFAQSYHHDLLATLYGQSEIPFYAVHYNSYGNLICELVGVKYWLKDSYIFFTDNFTPYKLDPIGSPSAVATTDSMAFVMIQAQPVWDSNGPPLCYDRAIYDKPRYYLDGIYGQTITNTGVKSEAVKIFDAGIHQFRLDVYKNEKFILAYQENDKLKIRVYETDISNFQELYVRNDLSYSHLHDFLTTPFGFGYGMQPFNDYVIYCNFESGCPDAAKQIYHPWNCIDRDDNENALFCVSGPQLSAWSWSEGDSIMQLDKSYEMEGLRNANSFSCMANREISYFDGGVIYKIVSCGGDRTYHAYYKIPADKLDKSVKIGSDRDDYIYCDQSAETVIAGLGGKNIYCINSPYKCIIIAQANSQNIFTRACGPNTNSRSLIETDAAPETIIYGYKPLTDIIDLQGSAITDHRAVNYSVSSALNNETDDNTTAMSTAINLPAGSVINLVGASSFIATLDGEHFYFVNSSANATRHVSEVDAVNATAIASFFNASRAQLGNVNETTGVQNITQLVENMLYPSASASPSPSSSYMPSLSPSSSPSPAATLFYNNSFTPMASPLESSRSNTRAALPLTEILIGGSAGLVLLGLISCLIWYCCAKSCKRKTPTRPETVQAAAVEGQFSGTNPMV
ncbi:MAG: hypothetical protein K0R66_1061 [Gammaproteobacteria bacterium]|jgi:pimeloyl-ACP methyl ester carboxylesterase|nr:hypothetical protein [Gammaproteobacteria bacterium]